MKNKNTMELPPLPISVTLNQKSTGAILHINCQSDGKATREREDREEGHLQAKQTWLGKLGCLLKIYGEIEYTFNDPWAYSISDFPEHYKFFAVERRAKGNDPPRKDYYLCGGGPKYRSPQEFYPHLHWLLDNAQGVRKPCTCQYCDPSRSQKQINKLFPLPPNKESAKGPKGPKRHKQAGRVQGPKGVTIKRGYIVNRNSITSGPVATLRGRWGRHKSIGYKTSHPFQS